MATGGGSVIVASTGMSELEKNLVSGGGARKKEVEADVLLGATLKNEIKKVDEVTAYIDPSECINCGTCRENCPADAIRENQRQICRICPTCTGRPGMSVGRMKSLPAETSCTTKCPLGISPQGYLGLTKLGKFEEAYELIWKKNPLPEVCARVCHHPCEDGCKRGIIVDDPIKIREIKRYLGEKVDYDPKPYQVIYEEKIAVIGAGPAGLTAGHYLASAGYDVTIYESSTEAGGMLMRGIPEFRLDRNVVRRQIRKLTDAGLKIKLNAKINQFSIEDMKTEYDAIIVAAGTPNSRELLIPGHRLSGIMTAMNFMEHTNHQQKIRRHLGQLFEYENGKAVIIGGGSVAMDCARAALRLGASRVTCVCLEEGDAVPAHQWEIEEAREEGIEIIEGYSPVEYETDLYPHLTSVRFEKVKSMGKDAEGKFVVETDSSDVCSIPADWVIEAIGQARESFWNEVSAEGIFFAGDIAGGPCSVIDAMASGRRAAIEVDEKLQGRQVKNYTALDPERLAVAPVGEKLFPYNFRKTLRPETPVFDVNARVGNFEEVEGVFSDAEAFVEVDSCLGCGYEVVDPEKCLNCGLCQKLCPKGGVIKYIAKEGK